VGEFAGAADGCELGNADGSKVGFKSDGLGLTDGSALGRRLGDADGTLLERDESVGLLLPVAVLRLGKSVGLALFVTVGPGESVGS
jgi:hypothetical protein